MPRITITDDIRQEICAAMNGLSGARARQVADEYAALLDVDRSRIYDATRSVRPERKRRSDKGKRKADPLNNEAVRFVFERMVNEKLRPDLAMEVAAANGFESPVSHGTLRRYARELGINRRAIRNPVAPHRRWEAHAPLERFQFDITGLKQRWWADVRTRRILKLDTIDVSTNHPNANRNRVPLWCFHILDDYSRFRYVRFVAVDKPNSCHVVDFLWEAFREMGIPLVLYTDNDPIIVSRLMRNAVSILDRYFMATGAGGFKLEQHTPGNPRATGKVEAGHQIMAEFWNLIGIKVKTPDLEALNLLAARSCKRKNFEVHSQTGMMPVIRFREGNQVMRMPPAELLNSAFKARTLRLLVTGRLTISVDGIEYQLPRSANIQHLGQTVPNPFLALAGQKGDSFKIDVVWPRDADYFVAITADHQFEFMRIEAVADAAGEYHSAAESVGQKTRKALEISARDRRQAHKAAGTDLIVPGIDQDFGVAAQVAESHGQEGGLAPAPAIFPRQKVSVDPALLAAVTEPGTVPPSLIEGRAIDFFRAADLLVDEGYFERNADDQIEVEDVAWLKTIFAGRAEILESDLRAAMSLRSEIADLKSVEVRTA